MNIWVSGCFDLLHEGHIKLLWYAKLFENNDIPLYLKKNKLFVGLESDLRVKMFKGSKRPINDIGTRMTVLSNLKMVDSVVIINDDDDLKYFLTKFEIDYIVTGDHYRDKVFVGGELAKNGIVYYPTNSHSTTNIIERIRKFNV